MANNSLNHIPTLLSRLEALKYHKDCGNKNCEAFFSGIDACIAELRQFASDPKTVETDLAFKLSIAAEDIFMERRRQILSEGWSPEHDDKYLMDELSRAAASYATAHTDYRGLSTWPWNIDWFKPSNPRRNLVKAGALILAEIERLDRVAALSVIGGQDGNS